jgi:sugar phosphate isomerase/epimerase
VGLEEACRLVADAGLRVSSLCRGGFFTTADPQEAETAEARNREAIDEAAALNAATLVLVPGGLPPGDRDLQAARNRAARAIERLVPYAHEHGVTLGIEPMNPIYAADRGVISTLAQALDVAERFEPSDVGVVVDTFHLWWEPGIAEQVQRAAERIVSYQVSDWITPLPPDTLLARGMMGDGHIDFTSFTSSVVKAGYRGDIEVEIFNADLWAAPPAELVNTMADRYLQLVQPYLDE